MNVYLLMTQWRDGAPDISGAFSSFTKAVQYFVRMEFKDSKMPILEMQSMVARVALKLAHRTDDENWADFGPMKAWIEECEIDEHCEDFEMCEKKQGE